MFETISAAFLCLAMNVYHEAKNQPFEGQVAVAQVVLNRVEDKRFPNTICEVVEQGPVVEQVQTDVQVQGQGQGPVPGPVPGQMGGRRRRRRRSSKKRSSKKSRKSRRTRRRHRGGCVGHSFQPSIVNPPNSALANPAPFARYTTGP